MLTRVLFFALFIVFSSQSFAQFCYTEHSVTDNVKISYKWKEIKDGPTELRLKFKNKNPHAVLVNLEVDYYLSGILKESSQLEDFCLKAKQMVAGKFNGVIFTTTVLSNEELNSEEFKLEINDITTTKVENCPEREKN